MCNIGELALYKFLNLLKPQFLICKMRIVIIIFS